jgi:hypothetical protein
MLALVLAGCDISGWFSGGKPPMASDPQGDVLADATTPRVVGKAAKQGKGETGLGVNAFLWRGALDTLSFMPLASEDPFGGVIQTDWYQPPSALDERFKATAYVLASDLRPDAIRVAIFREVMQGGQWAPAPVSKTTVAEIENKILARARQLRASSVAH